MSRCRKTHNLSGEDQVWLKSCDKCGETEYDIQKKLIADLKAQVAELREDAKRAKNWLDAGAPIEAAEVLAALLGKGEV